MSTACAADAFHPPVEGRAIAYGLGLHISPLCGERAKKRRAAKCLSPPARGGMTESHRKCRSAGMTQRQTC